MYEIYLFRTLLTLAVCLYHVQFVLFLITTKIKHKRIKPSRQGISWNGVDLIGFYPNRPYIHHFLVNAGPSDGLESEVAVSEHCSRCICIFSQNYLLN